MSSRKVDRRVLAGLALLGVLTPLGFVPKPKPEPQPPPQEKADTFQPVRREAPAPAPTPVFTGRTARADVSTVTRLSEVEFTRRLDEAPGTLGGISIGRATRGFLFGGTHMGESPLWHLTDPDRAWGTAETISALKIAINQVAEEHPGTHELHIGHISRRRGGWLRPHRSHQSGRDVDLAFYYSDESRWYKNADASNLDVARTWALLSALFEATSIEYVFVDRSIAALLAEEAARAGESPEVIRTAFEGDLPRVRPVVRHARGHRNHMHIRFVSPIAVENAGRAAVRLGRRARTMGGLLTLLNAKWRQGHLRASR